MGAEIANGKNTKNRTSRVKIEVESSVTDIQNKDTSSFSPKAKTERDAKQRKKAEKATITRRTRAVSTVEKKALELVQKNNKDKEDYDMIFNIIDKHFFMQTLTTQAREEIITTMSLCKVKQGTTLFKQGDLGNYWFIVKEGTLDLYVDDELKTKYKRGDSFGEISLLNDAPRVGTAKAASECLLWVLKREAFRKILDFIFQLNYDENMKFLNSITLPLDDTFKSVLANNLMKEVYSKNKVIFHEGDSGDCMYIIKQGEVNCMKEGKVIRVLKKGDNFGQRAILLESKRSLDVMTKTDCILYSISTEFFRTQIGDDFRNILFYSFIEMAFRLSENYNKINQKMLEKVAHHFKIKSFKRGDVMFAKGDKLNSQLVVVLEGNVYNKTINRIEAKRNEILYEKQMFENQDIILSQNLIAEPDCLVAIIDYDAFLKELGGDMKSINKKSNQLNSFEKITLFKNLTDDKIEVIMEKMKIEKYENGKKIINQGEIGDKFFIIKSGRVDIFFNSKYVRTLYENEEFGARALIIQEKRNASVIAIGKVEVYTLTANVFKSILEPNLLEYYKKRFYLEDNTLELKDLDNIKELGAGNFGSVNLVKNRKNKQLYAIKALSLSQIKKERLEGCVELEKNTLLKVDHPFIMKMVKYLKDDHFIFFIMEYIRGKELWEVIREIGLLSKEQTQFYGASLLIAIDYLHNKKIIYRDIKPENVMVNDTGYIKVIDFGTVKEIKDRTSTIIGTPHYMAPEIIRGEGYSFQVDIWSIAVCLYEFFCGRLPFGEDLDEAMDVYRAVTKEDLTFPTFVKDFEFKNLMIKMLKKSPLNRLWKYQQIKEDPYFHGFDWNKLISLSVKPPYDLKMKEMDLNSNMTYLSFIKEVGKKQERSSKRKPSPRQIEFDKWVKNF